MEPTAELNREYACALDVRRETLYAPQQRPCFVAWATSFDYGDGSLGLSFKETLAEENPDFTEPSLEASEAMAAPYSYGTVFFGSKNFRSYWVYMRSLDNGRTFFETGRAPVGQGSDINIGFTDGRILGYHMPPPWEPGLAWGCVRIMESRDGGTTWTRAATMLEGNSIYLWRVRRLRDGTVILMASLYGTAWGQGQERATRNTMLPDETSISKVQAFFMASSDGVNFSGPHYIFPGVGAHEFDMVELEDGEMLFIQGDVQGTPPARQKVKRENGRFINSPIHSIRRGTSPNAEETQGGFVPESIVRLPSGLLVGSRRHKTYSCSPDEGENWYEIRGLPPSLYQPFLTLTPDGVLVNFGHLGGDVSFGQKDMFIGADYFRVESCLPQLSRLSLERCMSADGSRYLNRFRARLTCGGRPVAGREVVFTFQPFWPMAEEDPDLAPRVRTAVTDGDGWAEDGPESYGQAGDIHFSYTAQAVFEAKDDQECLSCQSPIMQVQALRPARREPYPFDAYFAEGTLYLAPRVLQAYPQALALLKGQAGRADGFLDAVLPQGLEGLLIQSHVLTKSQGRLKWKASVHAPAPLADVRPMSEGDKFV